MMMSESEKPVVNADSTIQLDALDDVQLEDIGAADQGTAEVSPSGRAGPPPVPAVAAPGEGGVAAPVAAGPAPVGGTSLGKKVAFVVLALVLLAAAVAGGLSVGGEARE